MNLFVLISSVASIGSSCLDMEKLVLVQALNDDQTIRKVAVKNFQWSYGRVTTDKKTVLYFGYIKKEREDLLRIMRAGFGPSKPSEYDCSYPDGSSGVFYLSAKGA